MQFVVSSVVIVSTLVVVYLAASFYVALRITSPARHSIERTPSDVGLEFSSVSFESTDGLALRAWWVARDEDRRVVVLVPVYGGVKSDSYILDTAVVYAGQGFNVLMLDLRGQGESDGSRATLGYQEVRDVEGALAWLRQEGVAASDVVLHGFSMGGTSVARAAPGTGVAAVVADSSFADLSLLLDHVLPKYGVPTFLQPGITLVSNLFLDFNIRAVDAVEAATRLSQEGIPLFIIHSLDDNVVAAVHARLYLDAYPEAHFWELAGYDHVRAHTHPEYADRLFSFLENADVVPQD